MPEYYQNIHLNLKETDELDFGFYYDSKRHRYKISINYGEEYIDVTRKEGETILAFLNILREVLRRAPSNISSKSQDSQDGEESFEFQESDLDLKNLRHPDDEELFELLEAGSCSKDSSTSRVAYEN